MIKKTEAEQIKELEDKFETNRVRMMKIIEEYRKIVAENEKIKTELDDLKAENTTRNQTNQEAFSRAVDKSQEFEAQILIMMDLMNIK